MANIFLTDAQIAARYGVHRTTPWRWAKTDRTFPKPVKLSSGCTRWRLVDIEAWDKTKQSTA